MSDTKVAVWICEGCEIGKSLDVAALEKLATDECEAASCATHPCLCSDEGVEALRGQVADGPVSLVIAACSPRFNADAFSFEGCFTERINLRELVVWSHEPNDEDTQMLAEDYLRMGITRARKAQLPEVYQAEIDKTILVVGGGPAGMTAALGAAQAGHDVVLVEKEPELGGWLRRFTRLFPKKPPYRDPQPVDLEARVRAVEGNERIRVLRGTTIEKITGQPGQFEVSVRNGGQTEQLRVGAIVQATGWKPYDVSRLSHLGSHLANVVTNVQMEEMAASGRITRPSDGKPARRVAFIQCAGSRDENHLPYCSAVCCRVTLKQALWLRELDDQAEAYVLYKDIRAPGQYEDFYRRAQEDPGIFFTKGEVTSVEETGDGNVVVELEETLIDKRIRIEADLVVLATGMVPVSADGEAIRQYRDAQAVIAKGEAGAQLEAAKETVEKFKGHEGTDILHLSYRQGPDMPVLKYRFPDSHFICFPYETRRTGIYAAGCVRAPNDTLACQEDAAGAALKAIQCVELTSRGLTVHPRWEDPSYPDFFLQRCTQCKRCTEECPFGTLDEDEKGTPMPNITRCRRCGICMGACPERIVSFKDYSVDIVSSMIKAVHVPDEFEEKPRLLGLLCENDAYPALDLAGLNRIRHSPFIRFIPVRCLGSVNVVWIADALSRGYDGILLVGCKSGEDYQCHFIRGSELMGTRGENIREKLQQLALEEERVRVEELAISEFHRLPEIINEFADQIEEIGMNPFKGF
ncbi:MAG TPA: FAD-dependent oxidoreductase [Planctomycetaceae bacterium]|nr:FAD-dependent oxidoreductase [Planctomycetaceae bacterium]HIQ21219.1 FAD-dependent oxidoreductase [Planctomycetota bacterium]